MHLGEWLNNLKIWAESLISSMGYPGLGIVMFLENIFPPLPSEVVLPLAGSLTLTGRFTLLWVTVVGMIGSVAGATVFYGLGRIFSEGRLRALIARYERWLFLSVEDFDRAEVWFNRYGEYVIFFGRMVPIVRSLISVPAGLATMNLPRFFLYTALGTALWSFVLAFLGRLLGASWPLVAEWIDTYQNVVLVIGTVAVVAFVARRIQQRRLAKHN